jgi:hypothetical protein
MKFCLALLVVLLCTGCAPYFTGMGQNAATGAVNGLTTDDSKKKLDGLVTDATKSARDEALGPNTDAAGRKLIDDWGTELRAQINAIITAELQAKLKKLVRDAIDEALGGKTLTDADTLRERLVGPPLQKDLDDLIDAASPHLAAAVTQAVQSSLAPINKDVQAVQTSVDAEAAKWKPIAIAFAIGCALLLVCLVFAYLMLRHHRQVIDSLTRMRAVESKS